MGRWHRHCTGLRFVYSRRGASLLVADQARINNGGQAVASRAKTGRNQVTAPIFLLVQQVKLPKRLDLDRDAGRARDSTPGRLAMAELLPIVSGNGAQAERGTGGERRAGCQRLILSIRDAGQSLEMRVAGQERRATGAAGCQDDRVGGRKLVHVAGLRRCQRDLGVKRHDQADLREGVSGGR